MDDHYFNPSQLLMVLTVEAPTNVNKLLLNALVQAVSNYFFFRHILQEITSVVQFIIRKIFL